MNTEVEWTKRTKDDQVISSSTKQTREEKQFYPNKFSSLIWNKVLVVGTKKASYLTIKHQIKHHIHHYRKVHFLYKIS